MRWRRRDVLRTVEIDRVNVEQNRGPHRAWDSNKIEDEAEEKHT